MNSLTAKQQRVLRTIREFRRANRRMPTRQELASLLGYRSANSIQQYVSALREKGYLEVEKHKRRGVTVVENPAIVAIPLIGTVACGGPLLAQENIEGYVPVDQRLVRGDSRRFFFLRAHGDSMTAAGIDDGDLLLVESRATADPGEIVLALIGDEATVKLYKPGRDCAVLAPKSDNPAHRPIIMTSDCHIQGVVRMAIKREQLEG